MMFSFVHINILYVHILFLYIHSILEISHVFHFPLKSCHTCISGCSPPLLPVRTVASSLTFTFTNLYIISSASCFSLLRAFCKNSVSSMKNIYGQYNVSCISVFFYASHFFAKTFYLSINVNNICHSPQSIDDSYFKVFGRYFLHLCHFNLDIN